MTGPYLVEALIGGVISEVRYRKAARHITSQFQWDAFVAALKMAALDTDRRLEIEAGVKRYVRF